jgi:hypothetical protein
MGKSEYVKKKCPNQKPLTKGAEKMNCRITQKPLRIGKGITFKEAERIYKWYVYALPKRKKKYTIVKPIFITIGDRVLFFHETTIQVNIGVPNERHLHKRGWCDSVKLI